MIHGFASDQNDFAPLVPFLWSMYDEVVCPNLPFHGVLERKKRLQHKKIISFVTDLFDELKSRHQIVDVIGFSMGGALASFIASTRLVNRLVLLTPANRFLTPFFMTKTLLSFFSNGRERKRIKKGKQLIPCFCVTPKEMRGDIKIALKLFFGTLIKRYTPLNVIQFIKVINHCNRNLSVINCPTLMLWGRLDQLVRYSSIKKIKKHCKNESTIIVYPDVSHTMLYSNAKYRLTDDILRFLNQPRLTYGK